MYHFRPSTVGGECANRTSKIIVEAGGRAVTLPFSLYEVVYRVKKGLVLPDSESSVVPHRPPGTMPSIGLGHFFGNTLISFYFNLDFAVIFRLDHTLISLCFDLDFTAKTVKVSKADEQLGQRSWRGCVACVGLSCNYRSE